MKIKKYLDILNSEKIWKILRVFVQAPQEYSGRQMSELIGINNVSCTQYLEYLADYSILEKHISGKAHLYQLKRNYFTQQVLIPLVRQELELYDKVKERIRNDLGKFCTAIIIYGSYSRGEENEHSDLDVCLIVPEETDAFQTALKVLDIEFMNDYELTFSPHIFTEDRIRANEDMEVVKEIRNKGEWIYGQKGKVIRKLWLTNKSQNQ